MGQGGPWISLPSATFSGKSASVCVHLVRLGSPTGWRCCRHRAPCLHQSPRPLRSPVNLAFTIPQYHVVPSASVQGHFQPRFPRVRCSQAHYISEHQASKAGRMHSSLQHLANVPACRHGWARRFGQVSNCPAEGISSTNVCSHRPRNLTFRAGSRASYRHIV